ncbi:unnamed protein product [Urochloa decumbens]|uniref:Uncharacterized protein n=1 Tax=Urochloa decumbens TaxID=240449 RepID=A0ABC8XK40_9POAL
MDILDHSEEQGRHATTSSGGRRPGSRFGARRLKRRPGGSHQHLLLMDCVGGSGGDGDGASEETVPLPDYERLSQSARLPDDPPAADDAKAPPPPAPLAVELLQQQKAPAAKQGASPPQPPPPPPPTTQQQKPAAWRLIEYVRSRHKSGAGGAAGGCGAGSSDGDSKSSEDGDDGGEEGKKDKAKKKKRSSWLPDPDRRWPVQGFY